MRKLAVATLLAAAFALPATPADAVYCGELDAACRLVCEVVLDGRCPR